MSKRKILVVTGSRSEYGLLYHIMKKIQSHPLLSLSILVTGMHLSPQYGYTYKQVEKDGFDIDAKVDMLIDSDSNLSAAKAAGLGLVGISQALEALRPDIVLVYGDRTESLAAAFAAAVAGIPVAHVQGGDMVHGIHIDDSIRNAITRFAHIHFPVFPEHAERLKKMGEEPFRIHTVGFPGWKEIDKLQDRDSILVKKELGIAGDEKYFIVVFHPTSLESGKAASQMSIILDSVLSFEYKVVVFYPNSDSGSKEIIKVIHNYASSNPLIIPVHNLERKKYLALLKGAIALVGNSSSMIFDAPRLAVHSISVGWRQKGRLKDKFIHEVDVNKSQIQSKIKRLPKTKRISDIRKTDNEPAEIIASVLANLTIDKKLLMKDLTY